MYRQELEVTLEGQAPVRVVADQRDVAQLELCDWYGQQRKMIVTLRHLAYTAMRRQRLILDTVSWDQFNTQVCAHVDGVPDEDEPEDEQSDSPSSSGRGQSPTSGTPSSTSPSSRGSRSSDRRASRTGTPETSTP